MKVAFLDLKAQYESIKDEISVALNGVLEQTAFANGPFVAKFEEEFAAYCGTKHSIGVGSGTAALWTAMLGLGIGEGDEVITVPNTFIATAEAISFCGATPVFVDVLEDTFNMNPALIEAAITPRTKAIVPVHLYGQMCDMDPIMELARNHGLYVVEDACQAHGAEYKGRRAGSIGDAGCFSFYPGKNLGAYGEAGGVVTDNDDLNRNICMFRDHGQSKKYYHAMVGWNARMDGFQGAVLSVKLKHIDKWNDARRQAAGAYGELLKAYSDIKAPRETEHTRHVYHVYEILTPGRDDMLESLNQNDIGCGIHYPVPVHLQDAYASMDLGEGSFPVAEQCAKRALSLPMHPDLTREQIEHVAATVGQALQVSPVA